MLLPSSRALQNGALNVLCYVCLLPQGPLQNVALDVSCCVAPPPRTATKRGTECFVLCLLPSPRTATKRGTGCFVLCSSFLKDRYKTWHCMFCVIAPSSRASTKRGTECFVLCLLPFSRASTKRGIELFCFVLCYVVPSPRVVQTVALRWLVFVLCSSFLKGYYKTWHWMLCVVLCTKRVTECVLCCVVSFPKDRCKTWH